MTRQNLFADINCHCHYSGNYAINVGDLGGNVISQNFALPNFMDEVNADFPRSFLSFDIAGLELFLPLIKGARIELASREAFGRGAEAFEIANVMVFLASDYASYLVGEVISASSHGMSRSDLSTTVVCSPRARNASVSSSPM